MHIMLESLINKYQDNDIEELVYRLSYAGKFVIVKGHTLAGSLIIISDTYEQYDSIKPRFVNHLYKRLYDHYIDNLGGKFAIKILAQKYKGASQYDLLKREQMELDRHRYDPNCLNNRWEAYVPKYNKDTDKYGWISKSAVEEYKQYLDSKARKAYIKRYIGLQPPVPATNGL